ncbi:MAG: ABC transporter ATP-binding protein [Chloroflexi bacterium]|nr:ABC transporter ATP-binding protein [Chloroflexota bacterium]
MSIEQKIQTGRPPVIEIKDMTKVYVMGKTEVRALRGVSLTIHEGEYVAIIGASGSGKSTMMNMIGLLDQPSTGSYHIRGAEVSSLSKDRMADMRNKEIGFVFQRFNLLARTNARRQVELPLFYAGVASGKAAKMAVAALTRVGLGDRTDHKPDELSGGQQQRVAIARALVNTPSILLADEPTGALDSKTGAEVLTLFDELHQQGITLIVVTHDMGVARRAQRIITLRDGLVISDEPNEKQQVTAPDAHYLEPQANEQRLNSQPNTTSEAESLLTPSIRESEPVHENS